MSTTALLLVLAAAVTHASWNVMAHGVSRIGVPFLWWGAVSSTVIWVGAIPLTGGLGSGWRTFAVVTLVSGCFHAVYMIVLQRGYASGRLSTVYATARGSGPLISCLIAITVLDERPGHLALVGVAVVLAGVVVIGLLDREPERASSGLDPALVYGLLTGVAIAGYTIWDAHAVRTWDVSPVAYMVGSTAAQILLFAPALRGRGAVVASTWRAHWPRVLGFGLLSPLAYILVLVAITQAPVALVAPLREVSVVLVSLYGAIVLRDRRPGARLLASVIVVGGIALLAL